MLHILYFFFYSRKIMESFSLTHYNIIVLFIVKISEAFRISCFVFYV